MRLRTFSIIGLILSGIANAQPSDALLNRWEDTKIKVASASASINYLNFSRAMRAWEYPSMRRSRSAAYMFVEGDADWDITDGATIDILGDLNANISLNENSNLVIAGDVSSSSNIYVNNLSAIYVGGTFAGTIHATKPFNLHVGSNYEGHITIADGSGISITVHGDFLGTLDTITDSIKSARIIVHGNIEIEKIDEIYQLEFVSLTGSFRKSDGSPGIYHTNPPRDTWYVIEEEM